MHNGDVFRRIAKKLRLDYSSIIRLAIVQPALDQIRTSFDWQIRKELGARIGAPINQSIWDAHVEMEEELEND